MLSNGYVPHFICFAQRPGMVTKDSGLETRKTVELIPRQRQEVDLGYQVRT